MTPAVKQLKKLAVPYSLHQYQHDTGCKSFGLEAVENLQANPASVFKTLVVDVDSRYLAVAIIPVLSKLNLKKLAKVLQAKKVKMADENKVENSTGYVLGGVSPLGQKKTLTTLLDESAESLDSLFVSGGKRGLEIELTPKSLVMTLDANYANITNE